MFELAHRAMDKLRAIGVRLWSLLSPHKELGVGFGALVGFFRPRRDLIPQNAVLRYQLAVLRRRGPRARLRVGDRLGLLLAATVVPTWRSLVAIVKPETVLRWHRRGFRLFWRRKTTAGSHRDRRVAADIVALIQDMAGRNPWGAERIRGELLKLGIRASKLSVQK